MKSIRVPHTPDDRPPVLPAFRETSLVSHVPVSKGFHSMKCRMPRGHTWTTRSESTLIKLREFTRLPWQEPFTVNMAKLTKMARLWESSGWPRSIRAGSRGRPLSESPGIYTHRAHRPSYSSDNRWARKNWRKQPEPVPSEMAARSRHKFWRSPGRWET